jgi:hypothetical protein
MAMVTWLQMVSDAEIEELRRNPGSINQLDKPAAETYRTHYACSLNWFVTGNAWPADEELAPMLQGDEWVSTSTLENGSFGVTPAAGAAKIAKLLAAVDVAAVRGAVAEADFDELMDEEVGDAEILLEADDPGTALTDDLRALVRFYGQAVEKGLGVAAYTS